MGLKLKDVYNQRNGIVAFVNNLYDDIRNSQFSSMNNDYNDLAGQLHVHTVLDEKLQALKNDPNKKDEFEKEYKRSAGKFNQNKKDYMQAFRRLIVGAREETAYHMAALNAYYVVYDKYKSIMDANPGKEDDPVMVEYKKNVDMFKAILRKNNIYDFEIEAAEKKDPDLNEKISKAVIRSVHDRNFELLDKYHVTANVNNPEVFSNTLERIVNTDCFEKIQTNSINETNNEFFGMLKNAGYAYTRSYNCEYYACPDKIDKVCPGYKFNEAGEMVRKENTGFFSAIANFFHRLAHHNEVNAYNEGLHQVKEVDCSEALAEIDKMNEFEAEKARVLVDKKFLEEYQDDSSMDFEASHRAELNLEKANEPQEVTVGPGLEQID